MTKLYQVIGTSRSGGQVLLHPSDTHEYCVEVAESITNDEHNHVHSIRIVEANK